MGNRLSKNRVRAKPIPSTPDTSDHATEKPPSFSSAHKALAIPELLEHILLHLPMRDLFVVTRVNRSFQNTIKGSKPLKIAMNLLHPTPNPPTDHFATLYLAAEQDHNATGPPNPNYRYIPTSTLASLCPPLHSHAERNIYIGLDNLRRHRYQTPQLALRPFVYDGVALSQRDRNLEITFDIDSGRREMRSFIGVRGARKEHPYRLHSSWTRIKVTAVPIAVRVVVFMGRGPFADETCEKLWAEGEADLGSVAGFLEECLEDWWRRCGD